MTVSGSPTAAPSPWRRRPIRGGPASCPRRVAAQRGQEERPLASVVVARASGGDSSTATLSASMTPIELKKPRLFPMSGHQAVRCVELLGSVCRVEERLPGARQPGLALCLGQVQTQVTADQGVVSGAIAKGGAPGKNTGPRRRGPERSTRPRLPAARSRWPWSRWLVGWRSASGGPAHPPLAPGVGPTVASIAWATCRCARAPAGPGRAWYNVCCVSGEKLSAPARQEPLVRVRHWSRRRRRAPPPGRGRSRRRAGRRRSPVR